MAILAKESIKKVESNVIKIIIISNLVPLASVFNWYKKLVSTLNQVLNFLSHYLS